jgi:hypothetical protein
MLEHAKMFDKVSTHQERLEIINAYGGVKVYYRKSLTESPAYKQNRQEMMRAKAVGITFIDNLTLLSTNRDDNSYLESLEFLDTQNNSANRIKIPAKTMLIAVGTGEYLDKKILLHSENISYVGDCDPGTPSGSVVNALADAKNKYLKISRTLLNSQTNARSNQTIDPKRLEEVSSCQILNIKFLQNANCAHLEIYAPQIALNYKAGQFLRVQNYATENSRIMEPLALTPVDLDRKAGTVKLTVADRGRSSSLFRTIKAGEKLCVTGPLGMPLEIPHTSNVLFVSHGFATTALSFWAKELADKGYDTQSLCIKDGSKNFNYSDYSSNNSYHLYYIELADIDAYLEKLSSRYSSVIDKDIYMICGVSRDILVKLYEAKTKILDKLFKSCKLIYNLPGPIQCAMSGICGRCVHQTKNSDKTLFGCMLNRLEYEKLEIPNIESKLEQNSLFEKLMRLL